MLLHERIPLLRKSKNTIEKGLRISACVVALEFFKNSNYFFFTSRGRPVLRFRFTTETTMNVLILCSMSVLSVKVNKLYGN